LKGTSKYWEIRTNRRSTYESPTVTLLLI